jgi:hypothetical protein
MTAKDHLLEIQKYCQRPVDFVLINNSPIPKKILNIYQEANDYPIIDDLENEAETKIIRADLLSSTMFKAEKNDSLTRSLIRHHKDKLAKALIQLI